MPAPHPLLRAILRGDIELVTKEDTMPRPSPEVLALLHVDAGPIPADIAQAAGMSEEEAALLPRVIASARELTELVGKLPPHRSYSVAVTKLDEAAMWLADRIRRLPNGPR
jgi:hypothetical protein